MSRRRLVYAILILLLLPQVIFWGGALSNQVAMVANHGAMPFLSQACSPNPGDNDHICMTPDTHLKVLCDWINLHSSIWSPGDVLLALGDLIMGPAFWMFVAFVLYQAQREPEAYPRFYGRNKYPPNPSMQPGSVHLVSSPYERPQL